MLDTTHPPDGVSGSPVRRSGSLVLGVAAMALALCGCGFRPMYGQRAPEATPVFSDLAAVRVSVIADRSGQLLRNQLVRLLNPAADSRPGRYTLTVVKETVDTFAVERSGFATTASVEVVTTYTLTEDATGNPVLAATSRAVSGYNLLDNAFSTYVASGDARTRAIEQIPFEIRNRLAAHFAKSAKSPAGDT